MSYFSNLVSRQRTLTMIPIGERPETVRGLAGPVLIERDGNGVAHVTADDVDDALLGLGFCHARDRGIQMLLVRILARGEASEKLQATDEMLAIDRFFRRMNFGKDAASQLAELSPRARSGIAAYCRGVNTYFEKAGTPWELRLLGYRTRGDPWSFADIYLTAKVIGYVALAQSQGEVERWIVECVQNGVPRDRLECLFPGQLDELDEDLIQKVRLEERLVPETLKWMATLPQAMASNNWAVAGTKTASGKPILCNDPHLEVNRLPAIWYESVLRWRSREADRYAMGATMPGTPGIVIGRNRDVAWGVTYACMDCIDSWIEECRDGTCRRAGGWVPFRVRTETIRRKGKAPVAVTFHENEHGTLEGDPYVPGHYLSNRWSGGEETGASSLDAVISMLDARTVEDGRHALARLNNSSWNWVLADRDGNIGYQMAGKMPIRKEGSSGLVPLPGWDPANDWKGFAPATELPRAMNPPDGVMATANDDLNDLGRRRPINVCAAPYRADRIRSVLAGASGLTVEDMKRLQADLYSEQAARFMEVLRPILADAGPSEGTRLLAEWDLTYPTDSRAATLFERFYRALVLEVFGGAAGSSAGAFGESVLTHIMDDTPIFADLYWNFDRILLAKHSPWFGGRTREQIYRSALAKALRAEAEPYGRKRRITLKHILLGGKLPRFLGFDRGPFPLKGCRATVHQGQIYRSRGRETAFAPSYCLITDLATDEIQTTLPGGPSDRRFSKWFASGLLDWFVGRYKVLRGIRPRSGSAIKDSKQEPSP